MTSFGRSPGTVVEPVGDTWVAFSGSRGTTHLLNDESAAILECLPAGAALRAEEIAGMLAEDAGVDRSVMDPIVAVGLDLLIDAGLVFSSQAD